MHLIVGLGNIGPRYALTRHNIGFEVVDFYAGQCAAPAVRAGFKSEYTQIARHGKKVILAKPSTYMNLSGSCVSEFIKYFRIDFKNVLIIFDDVDFSTGTVKMRRNGSGGTHNGMKDIVEALGTKEIARMRIGIGKKPENTELYRYVLSRFLPEEHETIRESVRLAALGIDLFIKDGIDAAMNAVNSAGEKK